MRQDNQGRQIRYRAIADDLRRQIVGGDLAPGTVLPSEADLSRSYGVSRVTVRKALDVLREEALVASRQGFGWLVAGDRVRQSLGALSSIESQLTAQGRMSERCVLSFEFRRAPTELPALAGEEVLQVVRLNLADGQPFALVTVWCPAAQCGSLSRDEVEGSTFYELLDVAFDRAVQTINAALAGSDDAEALRVPIGSPLLVVERVSQDTTGRVVLVSVHRFPAHLTEFVVELAFDDGSTSPAGLRLVE